MVDPVTIATVAGPILGGLFGGGGGSKQSGSQTTTFRPTPELLGPAFGTGSGTIPTTNVGVVGTPADVTNIDAEIAQLQTELQNMPRALPTGNPRLRNQRRELEQRISDLQGQRLQIIEQQGSGFFEEIDPFQGFVPEAIGAFERGELTQAPSPFFQDAIDRLITASQQPNPLQEQALAQAERFIAGDTGSTDRLQTQIDDVLKRIGDDAQLRTQSEFNLAGRLGSPAETGVLADRVTDRAAPIVGELLLRDEARREDKQAEFAKLAPALGLAPRTQLVDEAQLLSQAAGLDQQGQLTEFDALRRLGSLLGFPGSFGGQQVQPLFENRTAGRLGGALAGLDLATSLAGAFGGGGGSNQNQTLLGLSAGF